MQTGTPPMAYHGWHDSASHLGYSYRSRPPPSRHQWLIYRLFAPPWLALRVSIEVAHDDAECASVTGHSRLPGRPLRQRTLSHTEEARRVQCFTYASPPGCKGSMWRVWWGVVVCRSTVHTEFETRETESRKPYRQTVEYGVPGIPAKFKAPGRTRGRERIRFRAVQK